MNNHFEVAIIGGGASGLLCATELLLGDNALSGQEIVVLERNDRVGKKLVATGNGQGNLSNANISLKNYHGNKSFFIAFFPFLKKIDIKSYLEKLGIFTFYDDEGKMFPLSLQANSVLDNLRYFLINKKCLIETNFYVDEIKKVGEYFIVKCKDKIIKAKRIVSAFGGMAGKQYGTDGSSYKLLENFGHKLMPLTPSLVQLKVDLKEFKSLKGIKEKVNVSVYEGEKLLSKSSGDLLFTEYGLSGSAIFKASSGIKNLNSSKIIVELLPFVSASELYSILALRKELGIYPQEDLLLGIVNKQLGKIICRKYSNVKDIIRAIKGVEFNITGSLGFNFAQTTKGGIDANDVNPFTMQSKFDENLYLTGELIDVDGDCGGYNLTFAMCSGILAAKSIKEFRG